MFSRFSTRHVAIAYILAFPNYSHAFEYGDPSNYEQAQLEIFNQTRKNPQVTANQLNISINEGISQNPIAVEPAQPLVFNAQILTLAQEQSQSILNNSALSHTNSQGISFSDRIKNSAYPYKIISESMGQTGYSMIELDKTRSLFSFRDDFFRDQSSQDRGRRKSLLDPNYQEIGIGLVFGLWEENATHFNSGVLTTVYGTRKASLPIILGVVYDDLNENQAYDVNEGIANVHVSASLEYATRTASAGGYGIEVSKDKMYTLTFTHPKYGTAIKTATVGDKNVKIDLVTSDFKKNLPQQCANFAHDIITIPCINTEKQAFKAKLKAINFDPLQFGIEYLSDKNIDSLAHCEHFEAVTATIELSCINIGAQRYWAILDQVYTPNGAVFEVKTFGYAQ